MTQSNEPEVQEILDKVNPLLIGGESVEAWAIQRRLFALTSRRLLVVATNNRLVAVQRHLLPGFEMIELRWQDIVSARVVEGIFGAAIELTGSTKADLASAETPDLAFRFGGLRKQQAKDIYRICQGHAQAWREKRRVRELEEMRARSGGISLPGMQTGPSGGAMPDITARLQQLKELHEKKLITDSEFEASKAKILSGL